MTFAPGSDLSSRRDRRLQVLERHLDRLAAHQARLDAASSRVSWIRLAIFLTGVTLTALAYLFGDDRLGGAVALVAVLAFAVAVYFHRRLDGRSLRARLTCQLAETQKARMRLDWEHIPSPLPPQAGTEHPFALDLNLEGGRSLHQLMDVAISLGGSQRLSKWLLQQVPEPEQVLQRQKLAAEMRSLRGFRSHLALRGALVAGQDTARWDGDALLTWIEKQLPRGRMRQSLILLSGMALLNLLLLVLDLAGFIPALWPFSLMIYMAVYFSRRQDLDELFSDAYTLADILEKFRAVLLYLERYPFPQGGGLEAMCAPFRQEEAPPSRYLRRVTWVASATSLQHNPVIWVLINLVVPWDLFFANLLEGLKAELKQRLPGWLETWYELEGIHALANFAYLNPDYTFPQVRSSAGSRDSLPFQASRLGHPLIPYERRVCNDFSVADTGQITLITGSNMSGKSTFLRTVGANLCLAFTGAPVCARELHTIPWRLFTCIQVSDSLNDGISYFYAEVRRLKALLDALEREHPYPLFFLIDEIFRGTNNRERQTGSQSYLRALTGGRGAGIISTHDLELTGLSKQLPGLRNLHFREEVREGRMVFDYRLRDGPCPTTNALKIMSMEGLPVDL